MSQDSQNAKKSKPTTFFQTESDASAPAVRAGSLPDIIARHLERQANGTQAETETADSVEKPSYFQPSPSSDWLYNQTYTHHSEASEGGVHINQLDGQMPSGVEHLLPTATTRYRVMKRRLEGEISALKAKVRDYQSLLSSPPVYNRAELLQELKSLQARLLVLQRRYDKACTGLEQASPEDWGAQLKRWWLSVSTGESLTSLFNSEKSGNSLIQGSNSVKNKDSSLQKANNTYALLNAELARPIPNPETVSALVFQYERSIQECSKAAKKAKLKTRTGEWSKWLAWLK